LGSFPNPCDFPLTTYNTAQGDFDEVLRGIFQISFFTFLYGKVLEMPKRYEKIEKYM